MKGKLALGLTNGYYMDNFINILKSRANFLVSEICELNQILETYPDSVVKEQKNSYRLELSTIMADLESIGMGGR